SRILDYAAKGALAYKLTYSDTETEMAAISDKIPNPEEALDLHQSKQLFCQWIQDLPAREKLVIEQYYYCEKSFVEIAADHEGMSKSWVSRLHNKALNRLKERYVKYDSA
ncbi:sigma-70 family RNA polymerase sigma factor, partial [Oligoflexia bacterium]|nr:sigma-70 family RNA polymerase sigma factor [Oligoflexia bacterium]